VLIRPDGFIAWRRSTADGEAASAFDAALEHLQIRTGVKETPMLASPRSHRDI
jgi:hypothetical protein